MNAVERLHKWFGTFVRWLRSGSDRPWLARVKRELIILVQVARASQNDEISRRAAALTYHTLLSLVPLLAVAFALFKAFGGFERLQQPLEDLIFSQLAIAESEEVANWLQSFVEQVNSGAIAGIGVLVLFYTATELLTNIEQAFNRVWNVPLRRPLYVRLAIYWCILTLAPPLVALSISISTNLINRTVSAWFGEGAAGALLTFTSPISVALVFFVIYMMVPDTHVPWRDAASGAIVAAVCWNIAKAGFVWMTRASSSHSAIYGALSALPLLMIWIYVSWSIVLFGAAFACARGQVTRLTLEPEDHPTAPSLRLLSRVVVSLWEHFHQGQSITAVGVAKEVGISAQWCQSVLNVLIENKILESTSTETDNTEGAEYLLRKHVGELSLNDLDKLLLHPNVAKCESRLLASPLWENVEQHLTRAETARYTHMDVTLDQMTPDRDIAAAMPVSVSQS